MRYDHFSMLPERAFQPRNGRHGMTLEGGGGGPSSSTTYTSNIPEWLRPQTETLLGAATQEYFKTTPVTDPETGKITHEITGIKPFTPYSTNMQDYVAGFSPQQQQVFAEAANMQRPGQYALGSQYVGQAGLGGLQSAQQAYGYGGMGAGYGAEAADIGRMGLQAQGYGMDVGQQARQYAQQAAMAGQQYGTMATNPYAVSAYMSPYQANVTDLEKQAAMREFDVQSQARKAAAARTGAFGGARQAIEQAEAQRNLNAQMQNIEAKGLQSAYDRAIQSMQYGSNLGLQGLSGAQQGLGTALQGGQLGLSGIGQALAGQQAAIQGAQTGLQGVTGAQAGYNILGQAGTNLANIGTAQQAADIARMQFQGEQGALQRAREQQMIDQAIQNYAMAQEYPYEQLSKYSGLLRGYYTPNTTQSTYQAYNPAAQMFGTATQAAGAIGALNKKAGGSIKEKRYAEGGITSIDQKVLADPTSFSPEMIDNGMESGSISEIIGAIGLNQIANAQKQARQQQGLSQPAPQGTILGDLRQQAMAQGIEAAPTNFRMAGGGIIAFDEGGLNDPEKLRKQEEFYKSIGLGGYEPEYTGKREKEPSSIADYIQTAEKYLKKPKSEQETEYEEKLRRRPEELSKQREMDRYLALMNFGAAMGGAKTGNFLQALSEGTKAAVPGLASSEKAYREGVAGSEKELAGLGAKTRAEEIEAAKMGIDLYGKAEQRMASKSNMKEYAENYVKKMQQSGDKRPIEELWNEGATKFAMITAAPRYESAEASQTTAAANLADKINKIRESVKNDLILSQRDPAKASGGAKIAIENAKKRVADAEAQIAALQGGRTPGAAPSAGSQITVGGKTFSKPPNMTDAEWEAYKKYAAGAK